VERVMPLYLDNRKIEDLEGKIDKILKSIAQVETVVAEGE